MTAPNDGDAARNVVWHEGAVDRVVRAEVTGTMGSTVWLTGLSGAGKSTIARSLETALVSAGRAAYVLDGDNLRHGLSSDLGFSASDRNENVRRVGEVAALFADASVVAIVALISPYRAARDQVRERHESMGLAFLEVFVDTPIEECRRRDPKGLYARAGAGEITGLSGVDDPYEPPLHPDLHLPGGTAPVDDLVGRILSALAATH